MQTCQLIHNNNIHIIACCTNTTRNEKKICKCILVKQQKMNKFVSYCNQARIKQVFTKLAAKNNCQHDKRIINYQQVIKWMLIIKMCSSSKNRKGAEYNKALTYSAGIKNWKQNGYCRSIQTMHLDAKYCSNCSARCSH